MDFASFLGLIDATYIYKGGQGMATFVAATISPVLLVVAIWIRLGQSQLEAATSGQGKWGVFLKDMAIWLIILGLYFTIASMLSDVFNSLYSYFQKQGSLGAIQTHFIQMIEEIDRRSGDGQGFFDRSFDVMGNLVTFTIWLIYYGSFLLATFLIAFLKLAHALCWSFALVWGLIAIPMSLTSSFKLLRGWGIFTGVVLLWPLFHFGGFALFNPIFEHAANTLVTGDGAGLASIDKAQLYLVMTFVNLLSVAIALAAPFVAQAFVSNSGSITGVVTPFALAATSMAGAGMMEMRQRFQGAGRATNDAAKGIANDFASGKTPVSRVKDVLSRSAAPSTNQVGQPRPAMSQSAATKFSVEVPSSSENNSSSDSTSSSSESSGVAKEGGASPLQSSGDVSAVSPNEGARSPSAPAISMAGSNATKAAHFSMAAGASTAEGLVEDVGKVDEATRSGRSSKSAQARRGAVLDRLHKKGKVTLKGRKE